MGQSINFWPSQWTNWSNRNRSFMVVYREGNDNNASLLCLFNIAYEDFNLMTCIMVPNILVRMLLFRKLTLSTHLVNCDVSLHGSFRWWPRGPSGQVIGWSQPFSLAGQGWCSWWRVSRLSIIMCSFDGPLNDGIMVRTRIGIPRVWHCKTKP